MPKDSTVPLLKAAMRKKLPDEQAKHAIESPPILGQCRMNNPWGNKDRAIHASAIVAAIIAWRATG
jgi:hypothetical protein